jgi:hypothetical protein
MKRSHLLISAAWLVQGTAWFVPAFASTPGWGAFLFALTAFRPDFDKQVFGTRYQQVLSAVSVATNLIFVVGSVWALCRGSRSLRRRFAWAAAAAFLVNAHWYLLSTGEVDLRIGYFLWWLSFLLLAIGLFDLAGPNEPVDSMHS